jgi:hypothetical protein
MNLKITNTYFTHKHKHYTTHWSNLSKDWHMLDYVWSTNDIKRVKDCRVWANNGMINSDHSAVIIEISLTSIQHKVDNRITTEIIDWKEILSNRDRAREYNQRIQDSYSPEMSKQDFSQLMLDSGCATATKPQYIRKGWYELSADTMHRLINEKNSALQKMRNVPIKIKSLWKEKLKEVSVRIKDATATAKAKWNRMLANQMNDMENVQGNAGRGEGASYQAYFNENENGEWRVSKRRQN